MFLAGSIQHSTKNIAAYSCRWNVEQDRIAAINAKYANHILVSIRAYSQNSRPAFLLPFALADC